jgi:hypothetical protein
MKIIPGWGAGRFRAEMALQRLQRSSAVVSMSDRQIARFPHRHPPPHRRKGDAVAISHDPASHH